MLRDMADGSKYRQFGENDMATKAARGTKRTCQNDDCGLPFYDLDRDPILCPMCDAKFIVAQPASAPAPAPAPAPEPPKEEPKAKAGEATDSDGEDALDDAEGIEDIADSDDIGDDDDKDTLLVQEDEADSATPEIDVSGTAKKASTDS